MKFIPLRNVDPFKSSEIIGAVAKSPAGPGRGIDVNEMRRRCRIIDALEKAGDDGFMLEDADHSVLVGLLNGFQFGAADPRLLMIIDEIVEAKDTKPAQSA